MIREAGFTNLVRHVNFPAHINSATRPLESVTGNNSGAVLLGLTLACVIIPAALFAYFNTDKRIRKRYEERWRRHRNDPPAPPPDNPSDAWSP